MITQMILKTAWDGEVLATLEVQYTNVWEKYTAPVTIPDGIQAGATNTGASLSVSISAPNPVAIAPVRDGSPFPQNPV